MSATGEPPTEQEAENLEEEFHKLQAEEERLASRTKRLEFSGPVAVVFSMVASALALAALLVALTSSNGTNTVTVGQSGGGGQTGGASSGTSGSTGTGMPMSSNGMMRGGTMMGYGGHGTFTKAQIAAANSGTIYVQLGDFWVAPTVSAVHSGKVTFIAKNVGMAPHELMIERAPIKMNAPGKPNEDAAQGMINDMQTGQSGHMTVNLKPGSYVLFCNVPGHYASGQHIAFTVTQ